MRVAERLRVPHREDGCRKGACKSQSDCKCLTGKKGAAKGHASRRAIASASQGRRAPQRNMR
eukprot:118932-Chlamydomonas_euryale.AAC.1